MDQKTKERVNLLASNVRRSQNEASDAVKELLTLLIDDAKDTLVASNGPALLQAQGEAQAFIRLHKMLTQEPLQIKKGE